MNKNKKNSKSIINPKNFKFKIYWVYIIIFLFFVGIQMIGTEKARPTNWKDFNNKMLQEGKVDRLTIVNKEKVFIYIKINTNNNNLNMLIKNNKRFFIEIKSMFLILTKE